MALMCQQDLEAMLSQGQEFYSRLVEHLMQLKQNISDFKMSRFMQVEDLCKSLGVPPPSKTTVFGSSGAPPGGYHPPPQGGPPSFPPTGPPAGMNFEFF